MKNNNTMKMLTYRKILGRMPMYLQVADKYRKSHRDIKKSDDIYIHVFAPTLIQFTNWVIDMALKEGRKRLYFLSRDGYQMYIVAKKIVEFKNIDIECRYINVSRYALRLPEYHLIQEKCLERICIGGIDVTFERIMKRAGLDDKEALEIATLCGYSEKYKSIMTYTQIMDLKEILIQHGLFFEYVYRHSMEKYSVAIDYLIQEGLFDDISYAIVDSGWVGTLHQTLNNLLISGGKKEKICGYYFGLYGTPKNEHNLYKAYYFEPRNGMTKKVNFSNCLFEAVFTSTEGMTLCYKKTPEGIRPVFDNKENPNKIQIQNNINVLLEYMELYCKQYTLEEKKQKTNVNTEKLYDNNCKNIYRLLKNLMGRPTEEEVEIFGNSLFSDDILEGNLKKVAAELTDEDIRNQRFLNKLLILTGLKNGIIHESAWIEGSIVRNGRNVKSNLRHARLYKYIVYLRKLFI